MLKGEGLIRGTEPYDRWNPQEFVAGTRQMVDVLTSLRAETIFGMFKVVSFITGDSILFLML